MAATAIPLFKKYLLADWANAGKTFSLMIVRSSYVYSEADEFVAAVNAHEITATGYARKNVTGRSASISGSSALGLGPTTAITFGPMTGVGTQTAGGIWLFQANGSAATDRLIAFFSGGTMPNAFPHTLVEGESFDFRKTDGVFISVA